MSLVIDFHFHGSLSHDLHPWVIEWFKTQMDEPETFVDGVLTREGITRYLSEQGVDYAVVLAELSPVTTGMVGNDGVIELCLGIDRQYLVLSVRSIIPQDEIRIQFRFCYVPTSVTTSSITASGVMPSASPSKFRIKRWRRAG